MKAILISIKPEWTAKILNGEKTIEIRKTCPKCEFPITVYIYCSKGGNKVGKYGDGRYHEMTHDSHWACGCLWNLPTHYLNGKVVAKFTLNEVEELYLEPYIYDSRTVTYKSGVYKGEWIHVMEHYSCLTESQMDEYLGNGSRFYAWHISDLEIFDEPKKLEEFYGTPKKINGLYGAEMVNISLSKPPRSWQFISSD